MAILGFNIKMSHFRWLLFVVLSISQLAYSNPNAPTPQDFQTFLEHWREFHQIPGVVVSISEPSKPVQTFKDGLADIITKRPVDSDSLFAISSISKTFISAMVLRLVAQHKLNLTDPVDKWLPKYKNWHQVTILQLLNMTSGIYRFTEDPYFIQQRNANSIRRWSSEELINIAYQHPNYFQAGTSWQYSNTNYLLLGLIIEKITQQPLAWALQKKLFQPLNLLHTFYISALIPPALMPLMAHGYKEVNNHYKDVTNNDFSVYGAAGSIVSNTEDMVKWIRALFTTILPAKQLQQLVTVYHYRLPSQPPGSAYGLGIFSLETPQFGKIWWYTGLTEGYSSLLIWIPNQNIAIAATINGFRSNDMMVLFPEGTLFRYLIAYLGMEILPQPAVSTTIPPTNLPSPLAPVISLIQKR